VAVTVHSKTSGLSVKSEAGKALVTDSVLPGTGHVEAEVIVLARPAGSKHAFQEVGSERLSASQGNFAVLVPLAAGRWQIKVSYQDPKQVIAARSPTVTVTTATKPSGSVSLGSVTLKGGAMTGRWDGQAGSSGERRGRATGSQRRGGCAGAFQGPGDG
jgi:hypothetical protein